MNYNKELPLSPWLMSLERFQVRPKETHIVIAFVRFRDNSSITSAKRWVSGVRKWQFLLIYSTIYADVGGWVGLKNQNHADVILEWSLSKSCLLFFHGFVASLLYPRPETLLKIVRYTMSVF